MQTKPFVNLRFKSAASLFLLAEDGALLGKIEKVRVLRNDRREGKTLLRSVPDGLTFPEPSENLKEGSSEKNNELCRLSVCLPLSEPPGSLSQQTQEGHSKLN